MKMVQIVNNRVHWITDWQTREEMPPFAPDMIFVEAPEEVEVGWTYENGEFIKPIVPEPILAIDQEMVLANQIAAQNNMLTAIQDLLKASGVPQPIVKTMSTDAVDWFSDPDPSEQEQAVQQKTFEMYKAMFVNQKITSTTVRQAVRLEEITAEQFEEITGEYY